MKYLIFDTTPIGKPHSYKAPFSDTFNWPRVAHISWICLDEEFKPVKDYDCIIEPDGYELNETIAKYCRLELKEIEEKGEKLEDVLTTFDECIKEAEYVFAHNLALNENVLAAEFVRLSKTHHLFQAEKFCLMQEATYFCKISDRRGGYKWPSLNELHATLFNHKFSPAGNARADVIAASRCFIKLMKLGQLEDCFDE